MGLGLGLEAEGGPGPEKDAVLDGEEEDGVGGAEDGDGRDGLEEGGEDVGGDHRQDGHREHRRRRRLQLDLEGEAQVGDREGTWRMGQPMFPSVSRSRSSTVPSWACSKRWQMWA